MRLLYFGIPLGLRALDRHGFRPVAACIAPLDLPGRRWARRTLSANTLLLGHPSLADERTADTLASTKPDLILSFFWPERIPARILALAPAYGTHPSLLPRHRGPDPYYWTIQSGDPVAGVTLHRLDEEYDTGAIVRQLSLNVRDTDNAWTLAKRLDRLAVALLVHAAYSHSTGKPLVERPQEGEATLAPLVDADTLVLRFDQPAEQLARLVRAAHPLGATTEVGDRVLAVLEARVLPSHLGVQPKQAFQTSEGLAVQCSDGALLLQRVEDLDTGEVASGVEVLSLFS